LAGPRRAVVKLHALTAAADAVEAIAENRFALPSRLQKKRRRAGIRRFPYGIFFVVEETIGLY